GVDAMIVAIVDERRTRELRRVVLRPHLRPDDPLPGDELADGVHFGAVDDVGTVLGTCFVYRDPCPWQPARSGAWRLRQMATAEAQRGRGIGRAVLETASAYVAAQGGLLLWCNARERAVPFYRHHGFAAYGDLFIDGHHVIPHQRMWRELGGRPGPSTD
ncbi:MAG: GNAT family N-acetyltransferase, partial [Jatrophihabitantaceae bacterium]